MNTEVRFLLAIGLMLAVLVGTNLVFPPVVPEGGLGADSLTAGAPPAESVEGTPQETQPGDDSAAVPSIPSLESPSVPAEIPVIQVEGEAPAEISAAADEQRITVTTPLLQLEFSNYGARMHSAVVRQFEALNREGLVDLVPEGADGYLGQKLVVGVDTVDLSRVVFDVEPAAGFDLSEGDGARTLRFSYQHPTSPFAFEMSYEFRPDDYQITVRGSSTGLERPLLVTDLGDGLAFAEADSATEARAMAHVHNHIQEGVRSTIQAKAEPELINGPLVWAAFRSKFFVLALLAGEQEEIVGDAAYLGGVLIHESELDGRVRMATAQSLTADGEFAYRLFMGPQDYALLNSLGQGMEEVNPYGWKFFRPIVRPFVSVIMTILMYLHGTLSLGYGWVLIIFGVMMRVVLFPLNHKAMKAQLRNMSVQPLLQEVQAKYKDQPEKLQKEMMKLYKDHGFNPLAGCLPMLLPWPVLIALFFVFQNTIELRGESFLWLPDLSAPDPLYLLPVFLGLSMFLMQYVSLKSLDKPNPQMKMMMWLMPGMMVFIFFNLASGLNLYYATANIATLPQQIWIANERKKMKGQPIPKAKKD
jgi:YidC/Oxa1 family membrane protein insertase